MKRVDLGLVSTLELKRLTNGVSVDIKTLRPEWMVHGDVPAKVTETWMHNAHVILEFREGDDKSELARLGAQARERGTVEFSAVNGLSSINLPNLSDALAAAYALGQAAGYQTGVRDANVTLRPKAALREDEYNALRRAVTVIHDVLMDAVKRTGQT